MNRRIFLSPPHMSGKEQAYITEVFESNYIAPLGVFVDRFEESIKTYTGAKHAVATTTGTAAIHLALRVLGVGVGDKVLASTFTFIGSVTPILYQGATPVFVDSNETWQIDPALMEQAIKLHQPKVAIVTHLFGQVAQIDKIAEICKTYGVYLIEDAAESLGATLNEKHTGIFGDMGVYSFNGNKILTTSGGGMLVSENETWIEKARFFATQAREDAFHYEHETYGYNYRMSNVLAAIGVAQMEVIEERVARRREISDFYQKRLSKYDEVTFMPEIKGSRASRWLSALMFDVNEPQKVIEALEAVNIESRPLWKPMHLQPLFKDVAVMENGVSQYCFERGICLPSGSAMSDEDLSHVCDVIESVIG